MHTKANFATSIRRLLTHWITADFLAFWDDGAI